MNSDATPFAPRSVAVVGAGAVGSYFGAMLARDGIDVTLVGRASHVDAIAREGLVVVQGGGEWRVPLRATTDISAIADAMLVLVSVKSGDTETVARDLARVLSPAARLISLQNGVDNAARIASIVSQPVYAAAVYVATEMAGPARVRHNGRGDLVLGLPDDVPARGDAPHDLAAIATMFENAAVPCRVSDDIDAALWSKLTLNCAFNAISALANVSYGTMARHPEIRALMEQAVREAVAVANADGVQLEADAMLAATWNLIENMPEQYSSTAQDLQRGKPTEIDALNGVIVSRGDVLHVATPINRALHALVKLAQDRRRDAQGSEPGM